MLIDFFLRKFFSVFEPYLQVSYAQEGEDLLLDRYLNYQETGFYVDIGAHHPKRFSNTYRLYKRGWCGINIEPTPGKKALFDRLRPRDINLEIAIGLKQENKPFYIFNDGALNTFSQKEKEKVEKTNNYILEKVLEVPVIPLKEILEQYLPSNKTFDLLSIDVEGSDFEVLLSNDWDKYKPKFILVESLNCSLRASLESPVLKFLEEKGYLACAKTLNTLLFSKDLSL